MPSVLSLIFPIEEAGVQSCVREACHGDSITKKMQKLTRPATKYESQLKADVTYFRRQLLRGGGSKFCIVELACSLTHLGHDVKVRYAEGGGPNCFRNLFHEFLLVRGKADSAGTEIVVECGFSEHFLIPCATPAYSSFYENLPSVFVGPIQRMAPLVELIVHEMSRSFAEEGITMPPWRASKAIMSKWAPQKATDRLPSEAASPRGASGASSTELEKPPAIAHKSASGAEEREHTSAEPDERRGSTGRIARCGTVAGHGARIPLGNTTTVGSLGTVHAVDVTRAPGSRPSQARHLRCISGCGSPALSIKVGFDSPGHRMGK